MTTVSKIAVEIIYVAINVGMAKLQAYGFDKAQERINHTVWALTYGGLISAILLIALHGPGGWDVGALWLAGISMHFPLFSTVLNRFRTPPRPWFYHNTTDPNGSKWDLWLGKYYIPVWFGCVVTWVILQFLIF